jgi:hypothetical protein
VHDRAAAGDGALGHGRIGQVALDEPAAARQVLGPAGGEVVGDDDLVAAQQQGLGHVAADEARAPRDEDAAHRRAPGPERYQATKRRRPSSRSTFGA